MTSIVALLIMAAATAVAPPPAAGQGGAGVELASGQARATIVRPAIVRQASGLEPDRDLPRAQVSRRSRTVLVEFQ